MLKQQNPQSRLVRFEFDFDKFLAAVLYIASKNLPDLDAYKICKMLFLSDKHHLVRYGRTITGDIYCALPHGPVPSMALDLLRSLDNDEQQDNEKFKRMASRMASRLDVDRRFQYPRFSTTGTSEFCDLSQSDLMSLGEVVKEFGDMNFNQLKSITHSVYAYKEAWDKHEHYMRFEDFFREDPGAIDGMHKEMLENDELRQSFDVL